MDEFYNGLPEDRGLSRSDGMSADLEFTPPDSASEFTAPRPETEYTVITKESVREGSKSAKVIRRMMLYTAAAAVTLGLLGEEVPPEPEPEPERQVIEVPSDCIIDCAVVRPDDPCTLYFTDYYEPGYYASHIDEYARRVYVSSGWLIVTPDGSETALESQVALDYSRSAFSDREGEGIYWMFAADDPERHKMYKQAEADGNLSTWMDAAVIEPFQEGSVLKYVRRYELDGELYQMTAEREIEWLSPDPDIRVTLETEPTEDGYSDARFRAVFSPQAGDDHQYIFGEYAGFVIDDDYFNAHEEFFFLASDQGMLAIPSFCTRWYDASGNFLSSGWVHVCNQEFEWEFPSMQHSGGNYIFTYDGHIRSEASDPDAAFYSVELQVIDASTGWHYLIESDLIPVTDESGISESP